MVRAQVLPGPPQGAPALLLRADRQEERQARAAAEETAATVEGQDLGEDLSFWW